MKIALLTIWHEYNYGAELQAYATIKVLQNMGHHVEMIDIRLSDEGKPSMLGLVSKIIESMSPAQHKFERFWTKFPKTRRYKSILELQNDPPVADIYMVGSDQVWNPDITKSFRNIYFLDFGKDSVKRVSYASSFGVSEWKYRDYKDDVARLLSRFDFISCREQSGVKLLKDTFEVDSENVVDPTLLLGEYQNFIKQQTKTHNLVCYPLGYDPELQYHSRKLAKTLNLRFVDNFNAKRILGRIVWNRNSVEQWVSNIANAEFVITRSYHGMLFSIMHQKQFAVVAGNNGRSARLLDFLKEIGLEDRYFGDFSQLAENKPWLEEINYAKINEKVQSLREKSINVLQNMLGE